MAKILRRDRTKHQPMTPKEAYQCLSELQTQLESHRHTIKIKTQDMGKDLTLCSRFIREQALAGRIFASIMQYLYGPRGPKRILELIEKQRSTRQRQDATGKSTKSQLPMPYIEQLESNIGAIRESLSTPDYAKVFQATETMLKQAKSHKEVIDLVGGIMSARYDKDSECDKAFHDFERLLKQDYLKFAKAEDYPKEAEAHGKLKDIYSKMTEMRLAPQLASKNICAVAGGFSSGKSSFLNALIGGEEKILPTNITPTTAIPTYIFHDADVDDVTIDAFNRAGGKKAIKTQNLQEMTHDFKKRYCLPLKQIVKCVVIYTPRLKDWKKVAFIDTPGYDSADGTQDIESRDEEIARQEVLNSKALIWLIDCEKGIIPEKDIKFILDYQKKQTNDHKGSVYIVLNKADKKKSDGFKILKKVKETTDKYGINCFGIGLYSVHDVQWYHDDGESFEKFMTMVNRKRPSISLYKEVKSVFDNYIEYHVQKDKQLQQIIGLMKRVILNPTISEDEVAQSRRGPTPRRSTRPKGSKLKDQGKLDHDLDKHIKYFQKMQKTHEGHAKEARSLKNKFMQCTKEFMDAIDGLIGGSQNS